MGAPTKRKWIRRSPFCVLRQGCLGFLIEWVCILVLLASYAFIGYFTGIFAKLAAAFEFEQGANFAGIFIWILMYAIAMCANWTWRCDRSSPDKDRRGIASTLNVLYHLVRWPIFLGMAATGNEVVITIGYWVDPIVAALVALLSGLVGLTRCCWSNIKKEIKEIRTEQE
jgi:hypothetical protein